MLISVICPVYNEGDYIEKLILFFIDSNPSDKELILADGNSTDRTRTIIQKYQFENPGKIKLLDNAQKYVPFALNAAIKQAKGEIIVRLDAHTSYNPDYFLKVIEAFDKSGADIVGGPMRIAKGTKLQDVIGYTTSTSFGIGNSSFHFEDFEGFADSVYLGAWKRKIFTKTGLFDEALKRNQDDEFHYRAKSLGLTIYQSPGIKSYYYPRNTMGALFKQYFEYGLYKPLVLKKVKSGMRFRHLIPPMFILYLCSLPLVFLFPIYVSPLLFYIIINLYFSFNSALTLPQKFYGTLIYPTVHIGYGLGFLLGLFKK